MFFLNFKKDQHRGEIALSVDVAIHRQRSRKRSSSLRQKDSGCRSCMLSWAGDKVGRVLRLMTTCGGNDKQRRSLHCGQRLHIEDGGGDVGDAVLRFALAERVGARE